MPNPWDVPPKSKTPTDYDLKSEALYEAVGEALSSWQYLEDGVASLFRALVNEGRANYNWEYGKSPAERAYGSVLTFEARVAMVSAAAEAFFHKNPHEMLQAELRKLLSKFRGWAARRNDIAHGKIAGSPCNYYVGPPSDWNRCALWPADSNTRKHSIDDTAAFIYHSGHIKKFSREFMSVNDEIWNYEAKFRHWRAELLGEPPWPYQSHPIPEMAVEGDPQ